MSEGMTTLAGLREVCLLDLLVKQKSHLLISHCNSAQDQFFPFILVPVALSEQSANAASSANILNFFFPL